MKIAERVEPLAGWAKYRSLPKPNSKSFSELWPELKKNNPKPGGDPDGS